MDNATHIKMLAFGDSITEGTYGGAGYSQTWPVILQKMLLADGFNISIVNSGFPGETATLGAHRFQNHLSDQNPDIVLIMYGANDTFVPFGYGDPVVTLRSFENAISRMVNRAKEAGIIPVLMTTTPIFFEESEGFDQNELLGRYMQKIHEIASRQSLHLIDHFSAWMEKEETVRAFLPDGVHPNTEGNRLIAETVFFHLSEIIRKEFNT